MKEKKYLFYLGILTTQHTIYPAQIFGILSWIVGVWSAFVFQIALATMIIMHLFFLKETIDIKKKFPRTYLLLKIFTISLISGAIFSFFCIYNLGIFQLNSSVYNFLVLISGMFIIALISFVFFWGSFVKDDQDCRLVGLAWLPFLVLMLVYLTFTQLGLEINFFLEHSATIGSLLEGVLLSIVLAFKTKRLKDAVLTAEKTLTRRLGNVIDASNVVDVSGNIGSELVKIKRFLESEIPELRNSIVRFTSQDKVVQQPTGSQLQFEVKSKSSVLGLLVFDCKEDITLSTDQLLYIKNLSLILGNLIEGMEFVRSQAEKSRMMGELESARKMQQAILSMRNEIKGIDASFHYQPAESTGGDWVGKFFDAKSNTVYLCCGDVTGHGLQAAFVTGIAAGAMEGYFSTLNSTNETNLAPKDVCEQAMQTVHFAISKTGFQLKRVMTMQIVAIQLDTGNVILTSAAHNPLLFVSEDKVKFINCPGPVLGGEEEKIEFNFKNFVLNKGDSLMLYTDGLVENTNRDGETIKNKELRNLLIGKKFSSKDLLSSVLSYAESVWQGHSPDDDCAIITFTWN